MPAPDGGNRPRASRTVKLVLMGVAGTALLYSCAPAIGGLSGLSALPLLWGMSNPFYRGPNVAANCGPTVPGAPPDPQCATGRSGSSSTSSGVGSAFRSSGSSSNSTSATTSSQSSGSSAGQTTSTRGGFGSTASSHGSSSSS